MKASLHPYQEYKPTGISWVPRVPSHWLVVPNRAVFVEVNERGHPDEKMLSVTIGSGVIGQASLLSEGSKKDSSNENKDAYKLVEPGDIAYNKMRAWQGAIGASPLRGIVSPAYIVMRPRERQNTSYFHYLFRTPAFATEAERWSYGIVSDQWSLRADDFKQIYCLVPPLAEQDAIARFMTHADHRFSRLIRNKRRLIALLNEEKQAIIQQAVTRGLDPDVPMKPSGVEWLGEIPAHWNVVSLGRQLNRIEQGWSPIAAEGEVDDDQWVVLTLAAVKRGVFDAKCIKPIAKTAAVPQTLEVRQGDVLLTRSNTRDRVGDTCLVETVRPRTIFSDLIYRLGPNNETLDSKYLVYQLLSSFGRLQIESDARGSSESMPKISQSHIRAWKVVRPPILEQSAIVDRLDSQLRTIDLAIERSNREIDLIREYRPRLIADVVAGQLDVRECAALLPTKGIDQEDTFANMKGHYADDGANLIVGDLANIDDDFELADSPEPV